MIVIDVGAARYGGDFSVERLIEEFHPAQLYAIDPNLSSDYEVAADDTQIVWMHAAAWIFDGEIGFIREGLTSCTTNRTDEMVGCFDLARFIRQLPSDEEIVLKIDAEKSEYDLLEHLIATRTDELLQLIWVEWHCIACGRGAGGHRPGCEADPEGERRRSEIERDISCELAEWRW